MTMTRAGDGACHVEHHVAVEIEVELRTCFKQPKSRLRGNSPGVIHVRSGPRTATGSDRQRSFSKILTKVFKRPLEVKQLRDRRRLATAPSIQEFFIPADGACLAVQVCVPPRTGSRIKVWLHMRPAVALNLHHAG